MAERDSDRDCYACCEMKVWRCSCSAILLLSMVMHLMFTDACGWLSFVCSRCCREIICCCFTSHFDVPVCCGATVDDAILAPAEHLGMNSVASHLSSVCWYCFLCTVTVTLEDVFCFIQNFEPTVM